MAEFHKSTRFEELFESLRKNLNYILCAVILLAVIAGVLMYNKSKAAEREISARVVLEQAKTYIREDEAELSLDLLYTVIDRYAKTRASSEALLYRGRAAVSLGDYDGAVEFLNEYIGKYPGGEFLPQVYSELGYIHEEKGNFTEAENYYSRIFRQFPRSFLAPKSMVDTARCLRELGEHEQAADIYRSLLSTYPWSSFAETALMHL